MITARQLIILAGVAISPEPINLRAAVDSTGIAVSQSDFRHDADLLHAMGLLRSIKQPGVVHARYQITAAGREQIEAHRDLMQYLASFPAPDFGQPTTADHLDWLAGAIRASGPAGRPIKLGDIAALTGLSPKLTRPIADAGIDSRLFDVVKRNCSNYVVRLRGERPCAAEPTPRRTAPEPEPAPSDKTDLGDFVMATPRRAPFVNAGRGDLPTMRTARPGAGDFLAIRSRGYI